MKNKRYVLILLFLPLILSSKNYKFVSEDWYILNQPGMINAISEDKFNVFFATENGIYTYDKSENSFNYDYSFSIELEVNKISHFYFDNFRGYYWAVHSEGVSFKSSISSLWRQVSLFNSGIYSINQIDDIGASFNYFWIKSGSSLYPFSPFSGLAVDQNLAIDEVDLIDWGYSKNSSLNKSFDISSFIIEGDWESSIRGFRRKNGQIIKITVFMEDDEGNIWIGTDKGFILKGSAGSYRLKIINIGLPIKHVTEAYYDKEGNWWFADSEFKRTGRISITENIFSLSNYEPFVCQWNEFENEWTYYYPNESGLIQNTDINSILRIGSNVYFGTMYGLLYYDLYKKDWNLIDKSKGLNDEAIWDIVEYNNSIYLATSKGVNELSIINHNILPVNNSKLNSIFQYNVFDIEIDSNYLYIATEIGVKRLDLDNNYLVSISDRKMKNITIENNKLVGSDGSLWSLNDINKEQEIKNNVYNYALCNAFVWSIYQGEVILSDLSSSKEWSYNTQDGIPGKKTYDVGCDDDWVWFLTNNGVAFYNWSRYHK